MSRLEMRLRLSGTRDNAKFIIDAIHEIIEEEGGTCPEYEQILAREQAVYDVCIEALAELAA